MLRVTLPGLSPADLMFPPSESVINQCSTKLSYYNGNNGQIYSIYPAYPAVRTNKMKYMHLFLAKNIKIKIYNSSQLKHV